MNIASSKPSYGGTANACRNPLGTYSLFYFAGSSRYAAVVPNVLESGRASVMMS